MKNTAKLSLKRLVAGGVTIATAAAAKAKLATRLLRQANSSASTAGHAGIYGLLLPHRPANS
jgi:hypothetical protein